MPHQSHVVGEEHEPVRVRPARHRELLVHQLPEPLTAEMLREPLPRPAVPCAPLASCAVVRVGRILEHRHRQVDPAGLPLQVVQQLEQLLWPAARRDRHMNPRPRRCRSGPVEPLDRSLDRVDRVAERAVIGPVRVVDPASLTWRRADVGQPALLVAEARHRDAEQPGVAGHVDVGHVRRRERITEHRNEARVVGHRARPDDVDVGVVYRLFVEATVPLVRRGDRAPVPPQRRAAVMRDDRAAAVTFDPRDHVRHVVGRVADVVIAR